MEQTDKKYSEIDSEFIPYVSYLDKNTILTKDSDILAIFKIPNFTENITEEDLYSIRETIRLILLANYEYENVSFYFTTIRSKADIISSNKTDNNFVEEISNIWNNQNNWNNQYVNDLYITLIVSPETKDSLFNPIFFLSSLTRIGITSVYSKRIEKLQNILHTLVEIFLDKLSSYGIQILSIVEKDNILYSEHMSFFSLLLNLENRDFPLKYELLPDSLVKSKMSYEKDYLEIVDDDDKHKFLSIVTLKQFQDLSLTIIDKILQLPLQLIITETCSCIDNKFVEKTYEETKKMVTLSEDEYLLSYSGLDAIVNQDSGKNTDFCIEQISVMLFEDSQEKLTESLKKLYKALNDIGVVGVRETIFLPGLFFSQLPANFRYIKRFFIAPLSKIATYFSMYSFPIGKFKNNCWGPSVVVIPSILKTPYFFNFHHYDVGNTIIVGLPQTGKTTILNFLISQTLKLKAKIFYIDIKRTSQVFINALNGKYLRISSRASEKEKINFNPFALKNTEKNQQFLSKFIVYLVDFQDDGFIEMGKTKTKLKEQYQYIDETIKNILSLSDEERSFEKAITYFDTPQTDLIYNKLLLWKEQYSYIFNYKTLDSFDDNIIGISLRSISEDKNLIIPVTAFLFHIVDMIADDKPFLFVIDDAWKIVDNPVIAPIFLNMLENGPNKNIATIVTTDGLTNLSESSITEPIIKNIATELYLENPKITQYHKQVFLLKEEEGRVLSLMKPNERNFLLKSLNDILIASIKLDNFDYYKNILLSDNVSINAMKKVKEELGDDSNKWVPAFLNIMKEYNIALKEKKAQEEKAAQMKWEEKKNINNLANSQNTILKKN